MRIHLKLSQNKEIVPFDHLPYLVGAFHKWVGKNTIHNDLSLYSLSWLKGAKKYERGLQFPNGATWFISSYSDELIKTLVNGIRNSPEVCCGMIVKEIMIQETPQFKSQNIFYLGSPVLVKSSESGKQKHLSYDTPQSAEILANILKKKLEKAEINKEGIKVYFDTSSPNPKTKLATYKGIGNKVNVCPVIIEGTPEQLAFAWNVGVGNSTGIGFGSLI
ncbi:CRISPR-associated endoribonuclease Cas6 [Emticicia sp. BO119]|uniref:CRISPR-associated endoribonuclease Cas6 n=1 Tax=Emticicia sp. BO119 TaxID=2757768 RepID=UPI0015F026A8|nr:CRISPR-associated endoribonuclease Cas6 [Emticicia sp. BO119]MBA4850454.1 CRISPR-associated endoribonuclease Cas6 [Emticicia sp. BO119]